MPVPALSASPNAVSVFGRGLAARFVGSLVCIALVAGPAAAQPPAGYYDTVDTANGGTLRTTLHEVIDDHTRFPYTDSGTDTWDIVNLADEDPNDSGSIVDLYRNASYAKIPGGVGAYNREHSWPKSYGFPNDGTDNYPYTDCHHLFAADASYNSARSNKPFRDCDAGCSEYLTELTDGRGGGSGVYPGNSNWSTGSFTQGTWETWGGRKGDVARAMFYMDVRYEGGVHGITGVPEPDLILTDDEALIDSGNTGANESVAYMGMLSVLLAWHEADPVDSREIWRNEVVYSFQGNRNPFIDHPEWAACVFLEQCSLDPDPPAAPTGLVATPGDGLVDLVWNDNGEPDLDGYEVYRSTTSGGPYTRINGTRLTTPTYLDTTAINGTAYHYVVTAVDTSGNESAPSAEVSATPDGPPDLTPPAPPTGLVAAAGDGSATLDWDDSGEPDLDGYQVYRSTTSGSGYLLLTGAPQAASDYLDEGLTNGVTYYYVVTAVDLAGNESAPSAEAAATPDPVAAPWVVLSEVLYDVTGSDTGLEWVELHNAGSIAVDLAGYSLGNGGTDYLYSTVQLSGVLPAGATFVVGGPTSNGTNGMPSFDLVVDFAPDFQNSGSAADGVALFDVPAAQLAVGTVPVDAVVYGPVNSNALIDETGAANAPEVGDAGPGSSIERVDLAGAWQIQAAPTPNTTPLGGADLTPPAAPAGLAATAGDGSVALDWMDNGEADLDSYEVYRALSAGGPFARVNPSPVVASAYDDATVVNGTPYFYYVTAVDTSGNESAPSATVSATPEAGGGAGAFHVATIVLETVGGRKVRGRARVTVVDEAGQPVAGVDLSGTFSGDLEETVSAATGSDGVAVLTTKARAKTPLSFTFCVDSAVHDSLVYDPSANVETCDTL